MTHRKTICENCGRESRLITEEQACGKTFQMTYEAPSCSRLSNKNKWASVSERLPSHHDPVLVYNKMWVEADGVDCAWWSANQSEWVHPYDTEDMGEGITHWMPLPEPPKEVNND